MKMQWTIAAVIAVAAIPAVGSAQQPAADTAKQGAAPGRAVNRVNESGDTTRSALRDSVLRNSTNTSAPSGASATGAGRGASANAREGSAGGATPLADSIQSMQGAAGGRPVPLTNEGGDTTRSALRDSLLRNSTRTPGTSIAPSTDASAGASASAGAGAGMSGGTASLSRAQARQLQTALNGAGCDAGRADGRIGRKTREAMACARQKNGISGNDDQALYKALGLSF